MLTHRRPPAECSDTVRVHLIAWTEFSPPKDVDWITDADGGQALVEFAGRAIYQSWDKPVPSTATNAGYVHHLIQVGHLSVLEHSSATFYITGISRGVAHEVIRHRHLSISELSPRVPPEDDDVLPEAVARDDALTELFRKASAEARVAYHSLLAALESDAGEGAGTAGRVLRKQARQAARAVLPHASPTTLVVTGNFRAWRHFVGMRGSDAAHSEIRTLAVVLLRSLQELAPSVFDDFRISQLADGTETAASPLVGDG
jgi:thymidylate synthase (FAD)